jgi:hypothetical protein
MVLTSWPILVAAILPTWPASAHVSAVTSLVQLQGRLGFARRWMRFFRFLDSLNISWSLYVSEAPKTIDVWFDIGGKTALGMYGLLETITILDLAAVDNLQIFGPVLTKELNRQAQIFWFVGLYASVLVSGTKLIRMFAYKPVPKTGEGYGTGENHEHNSPSEKHTQGEEDTNPTQTKEEQLKRDQERLRRVIKKRREENRAWMRDFSKRASTLGIKLLSDVLDMTIPTSAVGWFRIDPGLVGTAMVCTTVLTSMPVWERMGNEIDRRRT